MLAGPTQPEIGRLRVSDNVRRSEANRAAAALATARGRERRARIGSGFRAMLVSLRRPEPAAQTARTAAAPSANC